MTKDECQSLSDVIDYAADGEKTAKKYFVSGVNCIPDTARDEMLMIKKLYGKEGGRVAYVGNTGRSKGPHLHWETRVGGIRTDPMSYFE